MGFAANQSRCVNSFVSARYQGAAKLEHGGFAAKAIRNSYLRGVGC
jgi:hypothetical protein